MLLLAKPLLCSLVLHAGVLGAMAVCLGGTSRPGPRRLEASFAPSEAAADVEREVSARPELDPEAWSEPEPSSAAPDAADAGALLDGLDLLDGLEAAEALAAALEPSGPAAEPEPPAGSAGEPARGALSDLDPGAWLARVARRVPPDRPPAAAPAAPDAAPVAARVLAPLRGENAPPEYPPLARRRGLEGSCTLEITVDGRGMAALVRVAVSSGHRSLDEAAAAGVRRWRFENGPGRAEVVIRFQLDGGHGSDAR